jgi:hypothetical protein
MNFERDSRFDDYARMSDDGCPNFSDDDPPSCFGEDAEYRAPVIEADIPDTVSAWRTAELVPPICSPLLPALGAVAGSIT